MGDSTATTSTARRHSPHEQSQRVYRRVILTVAITVLCSGAAFWLGLRWDNGVNLAWRGLGIAVLAAGAFAVAFLVWNQNPLAKEGNPPAPVPTPDIFGRDKLPQGDIDFNEQFKLFQLLFTRGRNK